MPKQKKVFLLAGRQNKKTLCDVRVFWYNQFLVIWGMGPRTNSGQVS